MKKILKIEDNIYFVDFEREKNRIEFLERDENNTENVAINEQLLDILINSLKKLETSFWFKKKN